MVLWAAKNNYCINTSSNIYLTSFLTPLAGKSTAPVVGSGALYINWKQAIYDAGGETLAKQGSKQRSSVSSHRMHLKFNHMLSFNQSSILRSYVCIGWFSGTQFMSSANNQRQCRKYHYAAGWKGTDRVPEGWGKGPAVVLEMEFVSVTNQQIIRADVCVTFCILSCFVQFVFCLLLCQCMFKS